MNKIHTLTMSNVHEIKRFVIISDKDDTFSAGKVFWVMFWLLIFFPMLIVVLPYYARFGNSCDIKAELYSGEKVIYTDVPKKVISALHRSCEF